MNNAESASLASLLTSRGWKAAKSEQTADMVIINTCSVRKTAENRVFGRLGYYKGLKAVRSGKLTYARGMQEAMDMVKLSGEKPLKLVVTGCMAQRLLLELKKEYPEIDYVVGNFKKHHFGKIIQAVEEDSEYKINDEENEKYVFAPLSYEPGESAAFIPIMNGCNNFCSFCIVPHVRGREVSRDVESILREVETLSDLRVREITLLGQNVNSYMGLNKSGEKTDFAGLLELISRLIEKSARNIGWVRFMSSHPKDLSTKVVDTIAEHSSLCRHIHLPVQHGSSAILKRMRRTYTVEHYLKQVDYIRKKIDDVSLTTDIMIGFPGESEEDFKMTVELMKQVRYESAFMYYFNPREGTAAAKMKDQIPLEVKKERLAELIEVQQKITEEEMQKQVGRTVKALVIAKSRNDQNELLAKTERDERVVFPASGGVKQMKELIGNFATLKLSALSGNTFRGEIIM